MQIPSNHSLAIIGAYYSPEQRQASNQSQQQAEQQQQTNQQQQIIKSQYSAEASAYRGNKRFTNLQEQNLSHRGQQAQNIYQDIEMAGEAELLGRLDVRV